MCICLFFLILLICSSFFVVWCINTYGNYVLVVNDSIICILYSSLVISNKLFFIYCQYSHCSCFSYTVQVSLSFLGFYLQVDVKHISNRKHITETVFNSPANSHPEICGLRALDLMLQLILYCHVMVCFLFPFISPFLPLLPMGCSELHLDLSVFVFFYISLYNFRVGVLSVYITWQS